MRGARVLELLAPKSMVMEILFKNTLLPDKCFPHELFLLTILAANEEKTIHQKFGATFDSIPVVFSQANVGTLQE